MSQDPKRILIAEDNPAMLNVLRFNLARVGFDVQTASSGTEAARLFDSRPVDLVITDLQMPGMSGEELCRHIRSRVDQSTTSIMICSAKGLEVDCARMVIEFEVSHILFKPFSPVEMVHIANSILHQCQDEVLV